jgi:long-chain acyl-CoA synthetase
LPVAFAILSEPFSEQNRMINSTLKVARGEVESVYDETLKFLYTPEGKIITNDRNLATIF